MKKLLLVLLATTPLLAAAQGLQTFLQNFVAFLDEVVISFLLGIGFIIFVYNAIRYFVLDSTNEQGRERARTFAIYSIAAFVIIAIFWGVVNIISSSLGLEGTNQPQSDFIEINQ